MTLDELSEAAAGLRLAAPDVALETTFDAATVYFGKFISAAGGFAQGATTDAIPDEASAYLGATVLALAAIANALDISLDAAVGRGKGEIEGD